MNCYDLTLKYIRILSDIDELVMKKSRARSIHEDNLLDAEITRLEVQMFEIKNILKSKSV